MNPFPLKNGVLHCEDTPLTAIADAYGTPTFVYSHAALETAYRAYDNAFAGHPHQVCYAVKANPNIGILHLFSRLGAGFDIVSGGELARVIAAGGDTDKVVFSGVGKSAAEIRQALSVSIHCFNVESESELLRINRIAGEMGENAPISLRVNPDVDAKTHPYISTGLRENKFGIAHTDALRIYRIAASLPHIAIRGIDCHIGSQLTELEPFADALDRVLSLVDQLAAEGILLHHIDLGGGLGVRYQDETPPAIEAYADILLNRLGNRSESLILEPGRSLVANAGVLLSRVEYLKHTEARDFALVDAAMNDLMRPALYDAWHGVEPVVPRNDSPRLYDIAGPVCESGDVLARGRSLALQEDDLIAFHSAGAYGMSMSSNYNTRPRAAEVLVNGSEITCIRQRESLESLYALEHLPSYPARVARPN